MNKITILAIGAVFAVSMIAITAFEAEAKPPTQSAACPAANVQHWDTWSFRYSSSGLTHLTNPAILPSVEHHIKFKVDPLQPYERRIMIVDRLNELGYTLLDTSDVTIDNLSTTTFESSTIICAEN